MRKLLPIAVLLAGCSPQGWIRTDRSTDRIRTAFHIPTSLYGVDAKAVILSNSAFPCALPTQPDPAAITAAEQAYAMAWNREGTVIVAFVLFAWDDSAWVGGYPVDEAASPYSLDEVEPRVALAGFRAVWEAEVSEEDGLYREYQPIDEVWTMPVEQPGNIELVATEAGYEGSFSLDRLDVSGRFETTACPDSSTGLLEYLDLFQTSPPDTSDDTGRVVPFGGTP
jgi:hypothetical protein